MTPNAEMFVSRNVSDLIVSAKTRPEIGGLDGRLESGAQFGLSLDDLMSISSSGHSLKWKLPAK